MIRAVLITASIAILLGGCADGASNFGAPPPVALTTRELTVAFNASRSSNLRLRRSIDGLAQGNRQAVRARIVTTSAPQARNARQALIGLGLDPTRIIETAGASRAAGTTVFLSRTTAMTSDCAAAIVPAFPDDPGPSLLSLSRCTQRNNLAAMVVDPADLVAPRPLGPSDGAYLANGVRSWRGNRRTPLPSVSTGSPNDLGSAGATVPSFAPSTPTPTTPTPPTTSPSP
jgi:type IV pilus biogenesis protein CpaD/CtpE